MNDLECMEEQLVDFAANLLSQQVWCWGRDILRPQGNWLVEMGFTRIEPPVDREDCSSVYALELPRGKHVVLRGFGAFYGDRQRGGVFLPRYKFRPRYTAKGTLDCPPWSDAELPKLTEPADSQRSCCMSLTLELIDWIRTYEVNVVECLGIEYRRSTLTEWDNGERSVVPAEKIASAWRELSLLVASYSDVFLGAVSS